MGPRDITVGFGLERAITLGVIVRDILHNGP